MRFYIFRLFLLILVGVLYSTKGHAQKEAFSVDTLAARQARMLAQKLSLNTAQQQRLEHAYKYRQHELQKQKVISTDTLSRQQALQQIQQQYEKAVKEILTPPQWKRYTRLMEVKKAAVKEKARAKHTPVKELDNNKPRP